MFESLVMKWFDGIVSDQIYDKQFGGIRGTSTTDALVELIHKWSEATRFSSRLYVGNYYEFFYAVKMCFKSNMLFIRLGYCL